MVTGQALERKITSGGKQIKTEDNTRTHNNWNRSYSSDKIKGEISVRTYHARYMSYAVLGTEANFGFGRLSANRPKNVVGFRWFEGNNRKRNRELSGRLFGRLFHITVFFCHIRAPMDERAYFYFRVHVSRHIGTLSCVITVLHPLKGAQHTL